MSVSRTQVAEAYRLYGPAIYRRCLKLLGPRRDASGVAKVIFARLLRERGGLDEPAVVLPWIYRVTTTHCLELLLDAAQGAAERGGGHLDVASNVPAELFAERQLSLRVLSRLDEETRAVAVGILVDGMERQEVAQTLGISELAVAHRLDDFLGDAQTRLARSGT